MLSAYVHATGAYLPADSLDSWLGGQRLTPPPAPDISILPRSLKRGLSTLTKCVLHASAAALNAAGNDGSMPMVFGSPYGEIQAAAALMDVAIERDGSSPARFRNSVHNTAAGILSIARDDRAPATAVAAGDSTLAIALLEAMLLLRDSPRVLVCLAHEPVPPCFAGPALGPERDSSVSDSEAGVAFVLGSQPGPLANRRFQLLRTSTLTEQPLTFVHPLASAVELAGRAAEASRPREGIGVGVNVGHQHGQVWRVELDTEPESA